MCIQNKRPVLYIYSMAIYIIMGPVFCIYINMGPEFCIHINDMYSSIFMHLNLGPVCSFEFSNHPERLMPLFKFPEHDLAVD